jgi:hypothetical protein
MIRLLKVFLCLNGRSAQEYISALIMSIVGWIRHKDADSVIWKMFCDNASMFNEESGEVCFSVLARQVAKGGVRTSCTKVSDAFTMTKVMIDLARDLKHELGGDKVGDAHRYNIKIDGDEVQATIAFFKRSIREIASGRYRQYDRTTLGHVKSAGDIRPTVEMDFIDMRRFQPMVSVGMGPHNRHGHRVREGSLFAECAKVSDYLHSFDVWRHRDIWPEAAMVSDEMVHHVDSDGSDDAWLNAVHEIPQSQVDQKAEGGSMSSVEDVDGAGEDSIEQVDAQIRAAESPVRDGAASEVVLDMVPVPAVAVPDRRQPNNRKRKRKRKRDVETLIPLVGRVIRVPAWKFGQSWADLAFEKPSQAVVHMRLSEVLMGDEREDFAAVMVNEDGTGFTLLVELHEAQKWLVDEGAPFEDTPYRALGPDSPDK